MLKFKSQSESVIGLLRYCRLGMMSVCCCVMMLVGQAATAGPVEFEYVETVPANSFNLPIVYDSFTGMYLNSGNIRETQGIERVVVGFWVSSVDVNTGLEELLFSNVGMNYAQLSPPVVSLPNSSNLLVVDKVGKKIVEIDRQGDFVNGGIEVSIDIPLIDGLSLINVSNIAVNSNNNDVIVNFRNGFNELHRFDLDGNYHGLWRDLPNNDVLESLVYDAVNHLYYYVHDDQNRTLFVTDENGELLDEVDVLADFPGQRLEGAYFQNVNGRAQLVTLLDDPDWSNVHVFNIVPEPGTLVMSGVLGVMLLKRRRRSSQCGLGASS